MKTSDLFKYQQGEKVIINGGFYEGSTFEVISSFKGKTANMYNLSRKNKQRKSGFVTMWLPESAIKRIESL